MVEVLSEAEAIPAAYPDAPSGLSADAAALGPAMIWQRLESWIAWRWAERDVVYILEGPGAWVPRLQPATISAVELWEEDAWASCTLPPSPLGGLVLEAETYRVTALTGTTDDPPAGVLEAYRRLAEYLAEGAAEVPRGLSSYTENLGDLQRSGERPATWAARALSYSGAADLLRPYRGA